MARLNDEITAYDRMRADLETQHNGRWVVIRDGVLHDVYDDFQAAADDAVRNFGRGPYLIRQVGAGPLVLPASVQFPTAFPPAAACLSSGR